MQHQNRLLESNCSIESCNNVCIAGLICYPISETTNFNVTGSCLVKSLVYETVKISNIVPLTEWQYKRNCNYCWKILWYKSLYLTQSECCVESKLPVQVHRELVHYVHRAINITTRSSCITAVYNDPITSIDCNVNTCLYEASDHQCNLTDLDCYHENQQSSDDITLYSEYINLTKSLQSAQENLTRNQIHVSLLLQEVSLLQTAFSNANESYYINVKANESLTAETSIISPIFKP